jgi:hypothetical protein
MKTDNYECYVYLAIYPKKKHPDEISKILNIIPTEKNIAGEVKTNSFGISRTVKISSWFLSSRYILQSAYLEEHVEWILDKLKPVKDKLAVLQNMHEAIMFLNYGCHSKLNHDVQFLSAKHCKDIADLDLEFGFDAYFDDFLDLL